MVQANEAALAKAVKGHHGRNLGSATRALATRTMVAVLSHAASLLQRPPRAKCAGRYLDAGRLEEK
jgi:hypothetical protein